MRTSLSTRTSKASTSKAVSIAASALLSLAFALPAVAGPLEPDTIPRDAAVVAHIDLDAIRGSQTLRVVKKKLAKELREARREITAEAGPFDIDLVLDAGGITFWGKANDADDGAVIVEGADIGKVRKLFKKLPNYKMTRKNGLEIHSIDGEGAIAIVGSRVVLAKEEANLRLTVNTINGRKKSLKRNRSMPNLNRTRGSFVVVAMDDQAASAIQKQSHSALLSNGAIKGAVMEISERQSDVVASLTVETSTTAVARKLEDAARGGAALLSLAADEPELARLLSGLSVTSKGTSVSAEIAADVSSVLDMLKKSW